ncbi:MULTISPECIES: ferredoxin--NADP reductase [unclassified Achromobacter]|uniref:ferredoxin--NADP reductase n=1 Tax=unclassified Achromobacter TaxID=2626865 RepID=UPI000B51D615|nr:MULTISPECIES: ferredoxin--NADP reductase [unclassified Achromobacter]OWT77524.1 ferredoxin--NADP(+) reductase [Achromobacter sp. HZ28]OWT78405.1 ferredoxin--NADP(+) reductase [Achromobacter sp. HZ34]
MTDVSKYTRQTVTEVRSWVPGKLFSLRVTRDPAFSFKAGQFARVGLPAAADGEPDASPDAAPTLWRAYSMVSGPLEDALEFFSIVVPEGEFSPRLAQLRVGDSLYIEKNPYGFLTIDRFFPAAPDGTQPEPQPGQQPDLWLLATGTGLSAYLSILRDPATWTSFRRIIVVHGVRHAEELAYREEIESWSNLPEFAAVHRADPRKLIYLAIATRQALPGMPSERLTTLIADGRLEQLAGERLDPKLAKVMLCGNPEMLSAARKLLGEMGFAPGRRGIPGNLAVENYW